MTSLDIIVIVLWFIVAAPILAFAALGTLAVLCAPRDELARIWRRFGAGNARRRRLRCPGCANSLPP